MSSFFLNKKPRLRDKNDRLKRGGVLGRNMARADKGDNKNG
jgi:hypothetical protein